MLQEREPSQLPGELEGREYGVLGREGDEGGRGKRPVSVYAAARVPQRVLHPRRHALVAPAGEDVHVGTYCSKCGKAGRCGELFFQVRKGDSKVVILKLHFEIGVLNG